MKARSQNLSSLFISLPIAYALTAFLLAACSETNQTHSTRGHSPTKTQSPAESPAQDQSDPDEFYHQQAQIVEQPNQTESNKSNVQQFDNTTSQLPEEGYPQGTVPGANDIPTAKPGKNNIVESPFTPGQQIDVEGYPPGAVVKDPYTKKLFMVPMPATGAPSPGSSPK